MQKEIDTGSINKHLAAINQEGRLSGDELILDVCPFCGKKDHCYVNLRKEVFLCHHCGEKGNLSRLKMDSLALQNLSALPSLPPLPQNRCFMETATIFSYNEKNEIQEELLESPSVGNDRLWKNPIAAHYLTKIRGLDKESIIFFELGISIAGNLQIPFRNIEGLLCGYKYRTMAADKKYWRTKGSVLPLYNEPVLSPKYKWPELFITEGEFDCIIACQSGKPAVSSPLGAQGWNNDWTELIKKGGIKTVYLVYDNDSAGEVGAKKLMKTLKEGEIKCQILNPFSLRI